jgi:hypothetical protein
VKNYNAMKKLLPPRAKQQELIKNFRGSVSKILDMLKSWVENPRKKVAEFKANQQGLDTVLRRVGDVNPSYQGLIAALDDPDFAQLPSPMGHQLRFESITRLEAATASLPGQVRIEEVFEDEMESAGSSHVVQNSFEVSAPHTMPKSVEGAPDYSDDEGIELEMTATSSPRPHPSAGMQNPLERAFQKASERETNDTDSEKYSGLVAEIRYWVKQSLANEKSVYRELFLSFWKKLCLLDKTSKLEAYHARLHTVRALGGEETFLLRVRDNCDDKHLQVWSAQVAKCLGAGEVEPAQWVSAQIASRMRRLLVARKDAERKRVGQLITVTPASSEPHYLPLIWSSGLYNELAEEIGRLNENQPGLRVVRPQNSMMPRKFLNAISYRLLQEKCPLYTPEQAQNENDQLTLYLSELLDLYCQKNLTPEEQHNRVTLLSEEQAFYIEVARGLMSLGACPLMWMDKQVLAQTQVSAVNRESAQAYFLAAKTIKLILFHIEERASRFGESMLFLGPELNSLFDSFVAFSNRLSACVESDSAILWRLWVKLAYKAGEALPTGARYERATLLWTVLRYVYVILNDELLQLDDLEQEQMMPTVLYQEAKARLESARSIYNQAALGKARFHNRGTATVAKLMGDIDAVESKLKEVVATQRRILKSALSAKAAAEVAEINFRETQTIKQENQEFKQEIQEVRHEAQVAKEKLEQNERLHKKYINSMLLKDLTTSLVNTQITSSEEVRNRFTSVVVAASTFFEHNVLELEQMALEIVRTNNLFSTIRPIFATVEQEAPLQSMDIPVIVSRGQSTLGLATLGTFAVREQTRSTSSVPSQSYARQ